MFNRKKYVFLALLLVGFLGLRIGRAQEEGLQTLTVENITELQQLEVLGDPVLTAAIPSPNQDYIAVSSLHHGVWVYAAEDLINPICFVPPNNARDSISHAPQVEFSPDAATLAITTGWVHWQQHYQLVVWDVQTCSQRWAVADFGRDRVIIGNIVFNPTKGWTAATFLDGRVMVWETQDGTKVAEFQAVEWFSVSVTFNKDSSLIAVVDGFNDQRGIWSTEDWQPYSGDLIQADWLNLQVGPDGYFEIIHPLPPDPLPLNQFQPSTSFIPIQAMALSPDGTKLVATGEGDGVLYDLSTTPEQTRDFLTVGYTGLDVEFSPNGDTFLTMTVLDATSAGAVEVWSSQSGAQLKEIFWDHTGLEGALLEPITDATFTMDGQAILTRSADGIQQWALNSTVSTEVTTLPAEQMVWGRDVVLSPDKHLRAIALYNGKIEVWELTQPPHKRGEMPLFEGLVAIDMAFSPDSSLLAAGDYRGVVYIWDAATLDLLLEFAAHENNSGWCCLGLAFSPDGKRLYTGGEDGAIRVWGVPQ